MPKKPQTNVKFRFSSGKEQLINVGSVQPFLDKIQKQMWHGEILSFVYDDLLTLVNLSNVELITVQGPDIITKAYRKAKAWGFV